MATKLMQTIAQLQLSEGMLAITKSVPDVGMFEMLAQFADATPTSHVGAEGAYKMFQVHVDGAMISVIHRVTARPSVSL